MAPRFPGKVAKAGRGVAMAIRGRVRAFAALAALVFLLSLSLPVVVLSLARRPVDFFTFNPWLSRLPEYLVSGEHRLGRKLEFLSNMAIAWFSADNPVEGVEWGYVIDVPTLARVTVTSLLFAAFFVSWLHLREHASACRAAGRAAPRAGVAGAVTSVLGISTGPCSVTGCGVPVLPVVGLAITGLSNDTLRLFADVSRWAIAIVLLAMAAGTLWLGWLVASSSEPGPRPPSVARR